MNTSKLIQQLKSGHHSPRQSSAALLPGGDLVVVVKKVAHAARVKHASKKRKHKGDAKKAHPAKKRSKKRGKLHGKAKAEFLARMAKGRRKRK